MHSHVLSLVCLGMLACGVSGLAAEPPLPPTAEDAAKTLLIASPDTPANWSAGTPSTKITREGIPQTIRWQHVPHAGISISNFPTDWTKGPWNALDFWLYSEKATNSNFLLYIGSENPHTNGPDYYSSTITLNFTGWKHFELPFKQLPVSRTPLGWNHITSLFFTAKGWDNTPHPEAVVYIGPLKLVYVKPPTGPVTSDAAFFDALNLDYPGLAAVRTAVAAGDLHAAKKAFVTHLKSRQTPVWYFDWHDYNNPQSRRNNYNTAPADKICRNILSSCGIEMDFGEHIDWAANPTKLKYNEWTWQLSRHPFWSTLGQAYWATGNEKYAETYVRQIRSWIIDNPLPKNAANAAYSRWRTIETGIRTFSSWPDSFFRFLGSPSFDDDSIIMVVKSFYEHALHLREFPTGNNWLCMEMNGLFHIGTLFPEFKDAAEWRSYSSGRLYDEMNIQVYPDGAQRELAPNYHGVSLHNFIGTYSIAKLNKLPLPEDYVARLEKMYDAYLNFCSPTGCMPALNDSGWGLVRGSLNTAATLFPNRTDFLYVATMGEKGTSPSFTSNFMPWAGWYNMRTGWGPMDLFCNFEVGPFGAAHQHEDKLSFNLYAYGKRLLTEAGSYAYDTSQWRRYVLSARAHNVVRVDGKDQNRRSTSAYNLVQAPLTNRWLTTPDFDFGEGIYDEGFGDGRAIKVSHSRSILFIKPVGWIVFDVLTPADNNTHEYTTWFHYNTERAQTVPEFPGAVISADPNSANLLIAPLRPQGLEMTIISGQEKPEVQGFVPSHGYEVRPVATPTYVRKAAGQSLDAYFLLPVKAKEAIPVRTLALTGDNSYTIEYLSGAKDVITAIPAANGMLKHLSLVRQTADGTVSTIAVIE